MRRYHPPSAPALVRRRSRSGRPFQDQKCLPAGQGPPDRQGGLGEAGQGLTRSPSRRIAHAFRRRPRDLAPMPQLRTRKRTHLDMVPSAQSNPADVTTRPLMPRTGLLAIRERIAATAPPAQPQSTDVLGWFMGAAMRKVPSELG